MSKDNVLIDKSGSTIKYSSDGPDIEDLELEEEDIAPSPIAKIEKLLKQFNSKSEEENVPASTSVKQITPSKKEKKTEKKFKRPIKISLSYGNPKKKIHLFGNLEKIQHNRKNDFHFLISVNMSVKTYAVMNFIQISLENKLYCDSIVLYVDKNKKPFILTPNNKLKKRNRLYKWDVREFLLGNTKGEYTEIKINIS